MENDVKLRDDMMSLYGQLVAISFPMNWKNTDTCQAYYDLIDSILEQYKTILQRIFKDFYE